MQEDRRKQKDKSAATPSDDTKPVAAFDKDTESGAPRSNWIRSLTACAAIFTVAGLVLYFIFANEPEATREGATKKSAMLVSVETVRVGDYRPEVVATGTVMPAREIMLSPRVSGEVIERMPSFIPGGVVKAGKPLVKLDPADYEIAVDRAKSELDQRESALSQARAAVKRARAAVIQAQAAASQAQAKVAQTRAAVSQTEASVRQAKAALAIEQGRQNVAKEDFTFVDENIGEKEKALMLRHPQRQTAEAEVAAAEARVEAAKAEVQAAQAGAEAATAEVLAAEAAAQAAEADVEAAEAHVSAAQSTLRRAKLDSDRTTVKVPFDALVLSREVSLGSQVSAGGHLGHLVAVDSYWVEATVPLSILPWLVFPEGRDAATVTKVRIRDRAAWPEGVYRKGTLLKSIGMLEGGTRLARVLIEVADPLASATDTTAPALMLNSFVEVRVQAKPLKGVIRVNRDHVHEDDVLWVMVDEKLDIRHVNVLFKDANYAYIQAGREPGEGLQDGEQIVVSQLSTVVSGAALRLQEATE